MQPAWPTLPAPCPAVLHGVINLSLGGQAPSVFLSQAIEQAVAQGAVIVAAAGNENAEGSAFPASLEGVISVGALDLSGGRTSYSNFGSDIDVVAPGGDTSRDRNDDGEFDGISQHWLDSVPGGRSLPPTTRELRSQPPM